MIQSRQGTSRFLARSAAQDCSHLRQHSNLQVILNRNGEIFRSDSYSNTTDAIAVTVGGSDRAEPPRNPRRKWSEFVP
jgi:hypothetical protein